MMGRQFQVKAVPSTWIENNDRRLDCGPYVSGAIEARELLRQLSVRKDILQDLTEGGISGIINPGRISRLWVEDDQHGFPFLSSTDILQADLSNISYIAKSAVRQNGQLLIKDRWVLITRSGTIGRMAYSRSDMNGMACTEDVLRIIPDERKVNPGYLYAYLCTKFGVPLIASGTYGSIITHLEPQHIADLPVPRLGEVEGMAHELVQHAADLRAEANHLLSSLIRSLEEEIAGGAIIWEHKGPQSFSVEVKTIKGFLNRLDAFHHIGFVGEAIKKARVPLEEISRYADALYPPFMKRIRVEEGGIEFLGGSDMLTLDQRSNNDAISAKTKDIDKFIVKDGYVLFQCDGQRYGIFGRPILANRNIIGKAVTQHMMRIIPQNIEDAGYVSVYLATEFGRRFLMRYSAGTSIPSLNEDGARKILIYWPNQTRRNDIGQAALRAWENRARATELEDEARALVERTIEEGGR